jgi:hypothetical protein
VTEAWRRAYATLLNFGKLAYRHEWSAIWQKSHLVVIIALAGFIIAALTSLFSILDSSSFSALLLLPVKLAYALGARILITRFLVQIRPATS